MFVKTNSKLLQVGELQLGERLTIFSAESNEIVEIVLVGIDGIWGEITLQFEISDVFANHFRCKSSDFFVIIEVFCNNFCNFAQTMKKLIIINGPNLNLLGKREPGIYGSESFENYLKELRERYADCTIDYYQSNVEGELINKIQEVGFEYDGIILNAGAYTHTSVALGDCIRAVKSPVVEVHISNVHQREPYRHVSMISGACKGVICGFGLDSYRLAVESL